jgi:hypothetical protein
VHRTLNGVKVVRVWYNYSVEAICLISHEPEWMACRLVPGGVSVPQLVLYCIEKQPEAYRQGWAIESRTPAQWYLLATQARIWIL